MSSPLPIRAPWLVLPSYRRSGHMFRRNMIVYKHMWAVIVSGFFEPVFYLLGIGLGLGSMIGDINGMPYAAFVVPGLLGASCMNGALTDAFFNIFFKLHYKRTYDAILATPMRVPDVAFGEMLWAVARGSLYATVFFGVVLLLGTVIGQPMILSWWALLALPGAVLISASFSAMALLATSYIRKVQDFDIAIGLVVTPMFLFSGTFFPVSQLPEAVQWLILVIPLFHGVELLRALTTGTVSPIILVHVAYLVITGAVAFLFAMRRLERALIK